MKLHTLLNESSILETRIERAFEKLYDIKDKWKSLESNKQFRLGGDNSKHDEYVQVLNEYLNLHKQIYVEVLGLDEEGYYALRRWPGDPYEDMSHYHNLCASLIGHIEKYGHNLMPIYVLNIQRRGFKITEIANPKKRVDAASVPMSIQRGSITHLNSKQDVVDFISIVEGRNLTTFPPVETLLIRTLLEKHQADPNSFMMTYGSSPHNQYDGWFYIGLFHKD